MIEKRHKKIPKTEKKIIENSLKAILKKHPEISFAYIHGSFVKEESFKDIDVAIYLKDVPSSPLQYELKMETELMNVISRYPVDVRVLNTSPLSFKYNVIKEGSILIVMDDDSRVEFQETTLINYFDFAPHRNMYLKEALEVAV